MVAAHRKEQMYSYLIVLTICSTVGLQCWRTLFDNFGVNVVGLDGHHVGMLQSIREIPGFLALLVTYVLLVIREHRLAALSILILVFIAYAFVESKMLAGFLYVLDHIFFSFAMGIKTYFQKIADPRDIAASAAVGFTINHIAAVILPVIGGMLWMVNYKIPFLAGAMFSFISLCLVQFIPSHPKKE